MIVAHERRRCATGLAALILVATGCSSAQEPQRTYAVRFDQTETRAEPAVELQPAAHFTAQIVETHDQDGTLLTIQDVRDDSPVPPRLSLSATGASVRITPAGEMVVTRLAATDQELALALLVLRLTLPLVASMSNPPRVVWSGSDGQGAISQVETDRRPERARRLRATRTTVTVRADVTLPVTNYFWNGSLRPAKLTSTRPETGADGLFGLIGCALSLGFSCGPPETSVANGTLRGSVGGEVTTVLHETSGHTILQSRVSGHDQLAGDLATTDRAHPSRPLRSATTWTSSAELTSPWPGPPRPNTLLALLALALSMGSASAVGAAVCHRTRPTSRSRPNQVAPAWGPKSGNA